MSTTNQYFVSTHRGKVEAKKVKLDSESERALKNFLGLKNSDQPVYLFQARTTKKQYFADTHRSDFRGLNP